MPSPEHACGLTFADHTCPSTRTDSAKCRHMYMYEATCVVVGNTHAIHYSQALTPTYTRTHLPHPLPHMRSRRPYATERAAATEKAKGNPVPPRLCDVSVVCVIIAGSISPTT
eukprot:46120-Eustigmatos_ZCMA.PRE.1